MSESISIATVNCQGLATPSKRKDVLNYLTPSFVYKTLILLLSVNHISNHSGDTNVFSILTPQIQGVYVSFLIIILNLKSMVKKGTVKEIYLL
jgi:hypothetical protein